MTKSNMLEQDLAAIRSLADVLDDTGLTEVELERGDVRIRISRGGTVSNVVAAPAAAATPMANAPAPAADPGGDLSGHAGAVTSPMVGTAYLASQPGADPFVSVGTTVAAGQTLMIVEAMKTMNEIKAPKSGKVTQIVVQDTAPVEFGEVLMIVE